jgi:guanine deaminase
MAQSSLLLYNALALLPGDPGFMPRPSDILIQGGRLARIAPAGSLRAAGADRRIDASRLLVAPGLINGHLHSWDAWQKGCIENLPLEMAMSYLRPRKAVQLTERQVYLRTMIVAIEALRTGTTTVVDDMSLGQGMTRGQIDAAFQAWEDSGLRALVGFSMIDKAVVDSYPFVEECFDADLLAGLRALPRPDGEALLKLVRDLARDRHPSSQRVGVLVAPSAPHRCTDEFLRRCRALADELDLPAITHCQETRLQLVTAQEFYGRSLVAHLDHLGFLKPRTTLIHATWLSSDDIARIADRGASVQHNPYSNAVIGSGLAPVRDCLEAGINVAMGSDGHGILFGSQMLNTLAFGATLSKLRSPEHERWLSAAEVLLAATRGGAQALGLNTGVLREGAAADLVAYRIDTPAFTPLNDPVRQLVYGEKGSAIELAVIDGRVVIEGGQLACVNEQALLREMHEAHADLIGELNASNEDATPMREALLKVTIRALGCPIDETVRPAWLEGTQPPGFSLGRSR